jgi:hypothetical protein
VGLRELIGLVDRSMVPFILLVAGSGSEDPESPPPSVVDCLDFTEYLRPLGGVNTPGDARGVAIAGGYAYGDPLISLVQTIR